MAILNFYNSYTPGASANPIKQGIHELASTPEHIVGDFFNDNLGRRFRYAKSGDATLSIAKGCAPLSTFIPEVAAIDLAAGYAIGDTTIHVDAIGATVAANELKWGWLLTAAGHIYPIKGNTAVSGTECDIYLAEPLRATLADDALVQLSGNRWTNVSQTIATVANYVCGVPHVAATAAGQYLWLQTKGPCGVYMASNTDVAAGDLITVGDNGEFIPYALSGDAAAKTPQVCGSMLQAQTVDTNSYYLVDLNLEP